MLRVGKRQEYRSRRQHRRFLIAKACLEAVMECLETSIAARHEGIVYLLGRTDGEVTLALAAIRPSAKTTFGSFEVGPIAMAQVVRAAADRSLQVIGQVHTHPGEAYHSTGDITGTRIRYAGYVSVVLPSYGRFLPELSDAAIYCYDERRGFIKLDPAAVLIVPGRLE